MDEDLYKGVAFFVVMGVLLILAIRKLKPPKKYLDEVEEEGPSIERFGTRYLRDLDWLEIVAFVGAPILFVAILSVWGWWHNW